MDAVRRAGFAATLIFTSSALCTSPAGAQSNANGPQGIAIGLTAGTLGLGAEASIRMVGNFVVRLNGTWADLKYNKNGDGENFAGRLKATSVGANVDWHPFAGGFRLSGGARHLNGEFSGSASASRVTIGSNTYSQAEYGALTLSMKNGNAIAPYLGIGYDNSQFAQGNWFFAIDVGAMYAGTAKIGLSATGTTPGLAADVEAERLKLQDDLGKYGRFIPVVQLAAKYRF